ncbi:MAG: hypothetical protein ACTHJR_20790 [Sphingomonas sp.]|uniref:hypothetical protein n=1 Tax=Sphingomonas sp. TaxID=28214 RepID=UPI003F81E7ED
MPAILVAEREGIAGAYEIIDGLQRLQAIVSFIEGAFPTLDGKLFAFDLFPTVKSRMENGDFTPLEGDSRISQKDVSTLLDYSLALSVMRNATDAEVDDVFDRINTYGHRLSDQERRQAGVQNEFSNLIRKLASTIRGDASADVLALSAMPSISVDLPTTKHGYLVKADEVFWVDEGILRSTDLRDSMDEQCLADITASIVLGEMVDRSKDYLDRVYDRSSDESERLIAALEVYGSDRVSDEIKFCIDQIGLVCSSGQPSKLRDIVFSKRNTNGFPTVFAVILMAFHQLFVRDKKKISDYKATKDALDNIDKRINTSRSSTAPKERKKNVDIIRALIEPTFVDGDLSKEIYENHSASDVEVSIRRSEIELSGYELKQGIVSLGEGRSIDEDALEKILITITAIANNGKERNGKLLLGVTDKEADAMRVKTLDGIDARKVGKRLVVGVNRESKFLGKSVEGYHGIIRDRIKNSAISEPLKTTVLSNIDYNSFYGYGVIIITIPAQTELSFYNDEVYWREGDTTTKAATQKQVADLARRF